MQQHKIMIIDDSLATVEMTKAVIEKMGVASSIDTAHSVPEALESIRVFLSKGAMPDLIFLDLEMEDQSAFDLLETYAELTKPLDEKPKTLICILSDNLRKRGNHDKTKSYSHLGVVEQLRKPLDPEDILDLLEEHSHLV